MAGQDRDYRGVSCDSCLKGNFRGKRYKCLICYDYDLCATCYDAGATNTRHTTDHPMQCILTRMDFDLYYGGEAISIEQPQSFTCPFCGKMGFTETSLQDHVTAEHSDTSFEVVCPICAALPGGEPNHVTDDFASHLTLEHRSPRDLDEPSGSRHVRRVPHPSRGISGARSRRAHMQFSSSTGLASLSQGGVGPGSGSVGASGGTGSGTRDSMDPITELLSQLSGARRATANLSQPSTTSQLHQLQMQLQLERQQAQAARQQLERLPRRQGQVTSSNAAVAAAYSSNSAGSGQSHYTILLESSPSPASNAASSQFLLSRCTEPSLTESEQLCYESERVDHSLFIQELILSTLSEALPSIDSWDNLTRNLSQLTDSSLQDEQSDIQVSVNYNSLQKDYTSSIDESPTVCCNSSGGTGLESACENSHTSASLANPLQPSTQIATQSQNARPAMQIQQTATASSSMQLQQVNTSGRIGSRKSTGSSNSRVLTSGRSANNSNGNVVNTVGQLSLPQQQVGGGRGGSTSSQRGMRDGLSLGGGSRAIGGRHTGGGGGGGGGARESGGTSPSSNRRKVPRQVDDRNKSSEPPPPH